MTEPVVERIAADYLDRLDGSGDLPGPGASVTSEQKNAMYSNGIRSAAGMYGFRSAETDGGDSAPAVEQGERAGEDLPAALWGESTRPTDLPAAWLLGVSLDAADPLASAP